MMWFVNQEGNCLRQAATSAKAERLRKQGFIPKEKPKEKNKKK